MKRKRVADPSGGEPPSKRTKQPVSLLALPMELHLGVEEFLDPESSLAFSASCRVLNARTGREQVKARQAAIELRAQMLLPVDQRIDALCLDHGRMARKADAASIRAVMGRPGDPDTIRNLPVMLQAERLEALQVKVGGIDPLTQRDLRDDFHEAYEALPSDCRGIYSKNKKPGWKTIQDNGAWVNQYRACQRRARSQSGGLCANEVLPYLAQGAVEQLASYLMTRQPSGIGSLRALADAPVAIGNAAFSDYAQFAPAGGFVFGAAPLTASQFQDAARAMASMTSNGPTGLPG